MDITLNDYELIQAATTGMLRQVNAIKKKYKSRMSGNEWQAHIEGACGEIAAAKATGKYWGGSIGTFKAQGDLDGCGWEVRTRSRHDFDLIVRDDDADDRIFILVTGYAPNYSVRGWILAADAKRDEWRKDYGGHGPAYFVPMSSLRDMRELIG